MNNVKKNAILVRDVFLYGDDVDDRDYGDDVDDHDDPYGEVVDDQETNGIQFEDGGGSGSRKRGCVTPLSCIYILHH